MKVSLNWAQQSSNVDIRSIGDDKLLEKIGAQLGAIEEVDYCGPRFDGIVVVRVLECSKHDNADKLSVCIVDDGGVVKNVERDANGHVQVVCGAPNVHADMLAAWIPPGITVPSTLGKEPLVIEARDIRGQTSNGMLASLHELAISDDHSGILEIKPDEVGDELAQPGVEFKRLYQLDDVIVDIENKMFTHRPDCFGILGVARELAGIQQLSFKSPDTYQSSTQYSVPGTQSASDSDLSSSDSIRGSSKIPDLVGNDSGAQLKVNVHDHKSVPRFMAVAIKDVKVQPSPVWMQATMARVGLKSINNIVDITNFVMYLTGQPLHAYDLDKLNRVASGESGVARLETRQSRKGDKLNLLNGKALELQDDSTVLITSNDVPIGIGGVMGGSDTEVDANTKIIVLECANFDMYSIRRTAMKYGLFTDAVTRFNKGQSPLQNDKVISYAIQLITDIAGGQIESELKDIHSDLPALSQVKVSRDFINARLGGQLSIDEIANLLRNVEFSVDNSGDDLVVTAPFWRTDIEIPEDIVEEVGRLYGYDQLPVELPKRSIQPASTDPLIETKARIRDLLSAAGANELLTYSFVHGDLIEKVGQDKNQAYQLGNALSPDLQYYRLSLIPSLLEKVHPNIKQGYSEFGLFELNPVHAKDFIDEDGLPKEDQRLAFVFAADDKVATQKYDGAAYYQAKKYLEDLLAGLGIEELRFESAKDHNPDHSISQAAIAPFEKQRAAIVKTKDGQFIGELGEFRSKVRRNLKLPKFIAGFELDVSQLVKLSSSSGYRPIPRFPKVEQDITLKTSADLTYGELFDFLHAEIAKHQAGRTDDTQARLVIKDIYQKDDSSRNLTFGLSLASYERTLTTEEVNHLLDNIAAAAQQKFGAERI